MQVGEEREIEIQDFFELSKNGGVYEIETPDGWVEIGDLILKKNKECYLIRTNNGLNLGGSDSHYVETTNGWKSLKEIDVQNDIVYTKNGPEEIVAKEYLGIDDTYDLEVKNEHHKYYANDIVSHNTGKTLLCKVLANSTDVSVIYVLPSHIHDISDIQDICQMAQDLAPTMLVIEDIDWLAEDRESHGFSGATVELMNKLDGIEDFKGVVTIATTNRCDTVEEAIKNRPGRFDRVIQIEPPDQDGRVKMLQVFLGKFKLAKDFSIDKAAEKCEGMSGAYLNNLCDTAAIIAVDDGSYNKKEEIIIRQKHIIASYKEIKDKDFSQLAENESKKGIGFGAKSKLMDEDW